MSLKGAVLFLLVICALALVSGPPFRRLLARVAGWARPPLLRRGPDDGSAFRLGRLAGRLAARRRGR